MVRTLFLYDTAADAFNKKEKSLYFLMLLFFFSLYMPGITWLYNVCMWLIFAYSFFFNTPLEKWKLLKNRSGIIFILLFFLFNCASALLSENRKEGISWVGIRISLIVFPIALGSILINYRLKERILFGFVVATCCAAAACMVNGIIRVSSHGDWSLLYNDNLSRIINRQSIYFAMLLNLALISFGYLQVKKSPLVGASAWWVLLILLPVHFLLASRIAIIILYSIVIFFALYMIIQKKKKRQGIALIISLATAGCLFFLIFPKTLNRFKEIGYTDFNYSSMAKESHFNMALTPDQWNGANIRIAVWECAWMVTRHHLLLGTGLGDKMDALRRQYALKNFGFAIKTNRNVHNTYLDVWMSLGLIGLLIFLCGFFILPAVQCMQLQDWFGLLVLACLCISLFTETYLDRTVGNTILSFFLSFIACYKRPATGNY